MKLIALLPFFDEPVRDLVACVASLGEADCTDVVAVDGAYALFPDGKASSPTEQHAALVIACRDLGIHLTLHVPRCTWAGGETEKRTFLFKLGLAVADPGDWFMTIDADEIVTRAPDDLYERLEMTDRECADITEVDTVALRANQKNWLPRFTTRRLFRAQPITVRTNHITYVTADGRLLWGYEDGESVLETPLDLTGVFEFEHRPDRRPEHRLLAKLQYYAARNAERVERGSCSLCDEPAVDLVPTRWRMTDIGPVGDWAEACAPCAKRIQTVNRAELVRLGVNPDSFVAENRLGVAPAPVTAGP